MFPRRKTGSLLAAFVFIAIFWYFYNAPPSVQPYVDNLSGQPKPVSTELEKPIVDQPLGSAELPITLSGSVQEPTAASKRPSVGHYPVESFISLPTGKPVEIAKLQHAIETETSDAKAERLERQAAVKASFLHSWGGYKKHAWLKDEVTPVKAGFINSFSGWAATLVDALDTLWMMGLKDEFEDAIKSLDEIDFSTTESEDINVFETTIRYLGGFLGAYDISHQQYPKLLEKAREVGELLYGAFDTPNRMPVTRWEWRKAKNGEMQEASESTLIAELGSLTLEFTRLSQLTNDPKYFDAIQRISNALEEAQSHTHLPGMWAVIANAAQLTFSDSSFTLGGMADSLYEYLPKQHMLLGGLTKQYREMYEASMEPIKEYIFFKPMTPDNADILVSGAVRASTTSDGELRVRKEAKGQHLGCFTGGMVGIGAKIFDRPEDLDIARKLVDGCIWAYNHTQTGIMPEVFQMVPCPDEGSCEWNETLWQSTIVGEYPDNSASDSMSLEERAKNAMKDQRLPAGFTEILDRRYILRPEAIESVFIMYRLTGDKALQDAAWRMFNAIEKYTKTDIASAAIKDMTMTEPPKDNRMESFWLAETLKYFYAIFSDPDILDLDEFVLSVAFVLTKCRQGFR